MGHLVNAVFIWGIARAYGGRILLRVEDHDRTRCRPEYERGLLDELEWLGLEGDVGTVASFSERPHPLRQSDQSERYARALALLEQGGHVYACNCTRRDIASVAPREPGAEMRYPGTCRAAHVPANATPARRIRVDALHEVFDDLRLGSLVQEPSLQCGDVLARDRHGNWTYQFAVTVDDFAQEIDLIIRGEDLLHSTGRQRYLARLLGRVAMPRTLHHALVYRADGTKLSKANGDAALRDRRRGGASPAALFGEAAWLAGLQSTPRSIAVADLPALFLG